MQPQVIAGRYQVLRAIGRGGMGTVWLCRDEVLGREVAVKQVGAMPGDSASQTKRAMREARSAAALNHPNAVAVYDVVEHDGRPWLVMEYVEGQTLAEEISRDGQLAPQRVADIGAQLASALARAHERRIVHRDIKPGNVLIDKAGRPKISDFGIARGHGDEQLTQVGFITGTPGFLSPELARGGDPHPASDVWALGATLYAAVEGQPPYEPRSNPIALLRAIATERPRAMTKSGALKPAIDAMMHEDPACRWDMATSARRLRAIARAGAPAYPPRVDPSVTRVFATPILDSTQALGLTQRLDPAEPVAGLPVSRVPEATQATSAEPEATRAASRVSEATQATSAVSEATQATSAVPEATRAGSKVPEATQATSAVPEATQATSAVPEATRAGSKVPEATQATSAVPEATQAVASVPAAMKQKVTGSAKPEARTPTVTKSAAEPPAPPAPRSSHRGALTPEPQGQRSTRRWLPLVFVALLVVLGGGYLLSPLGDQSNTNLKPVATSAPDPATTTSPGPSSTSEAPRATATSVPTSPTLAPSKNADKRLENFVTSYYSGVTKNTDQTWGQLTPTMQGTARGRKSYDGFWSTIRKVTVNEVRANATDNTAVATLTFTSQNGRTSTESHSFTFVKNGEGYLIDSDTLG